MVTAPIQPEINGGDSDSGNSDSESGIYDLTKGAILKVLIFRWDRPTYHVFSVPAINSILQFEQLFLTIKKSQISLKNYAEKIDQ